MSHSRYIRQTILPEFGEAGQKALSKSAVLVVGAGGLGLPVLQYLTAMGVGNLGVVEYDRVEESNLHRQVLFDAADVGKSKTEVLKRKLPEQNSEIHFHFFEEKLHPSNALNIIRPYDVVVDCSDNFPTRYLINDACVLLQKPFVYGAIQGFEGQVSVFNYQNGPTYRCLYPQMPQASQIPDCNTNGVLGVLPGIIGNLQALETIKLIAGIGELLSGKLLIFDGLSQDFRKINFKRKPLAEIKKLQENYSLNDTMLQMTLRDLLSLPQTENKMLIDVRTPHEFEQFHLEGSVNFPLDALTDSLHEIDPGKNLYLLCQSGVRSLKACQILKRNLPQAQIFQISDGLQSIHHGN